MISSLTVGGVYESLKAVIGLTKVAADSAVDQKVKAAIFEVQSALYSLQGDALQEREARGKLIAELERMQRELEDLKNQRAKLDGYELYEIEPGHFVYESISQEPSSLNHYVCPKCYQSGTLGILQTTKLKTGQTSWNCSLGCGFVLLTGVARPMPPIRPSSYNARQW